MKIPKSGILMYSAFFCFPILAFSQANPIQKYVDSSGVQGSFTLYNYQDKSWIYSDQIDANLPTTPASTFKIFNSLVALEKKAVKDENEIIKWDSVVRTNKNWNADHDLKSAFKNSTLWFYQEVARRLNKKTYLKYLAKCEFGNQTIGEKLDMFWIDGSLKISPTNQIEFLVKLHEEKLPFSKKTMRKVKEIMIYETTDTYILRAKTGWGFENGQNIGWWIGYFNIKGNIYFFATRLTCPEEEEPADFGERRKKITYEMMRFLNLIR